MIATPRRAPPNRDARRGSRRRSCILCTGHSAAAIQNRAGPARPAHVHNKVHQVDCTPIVKGLVEHSYYLVGHANADIRMSIDGKSHDDPSRHRNRIGVMGNQ